MSGEVSHQQVYVNRDDSNLSGVPYPTKAGTIAGKASNEVNAPEKLDDEILGETTTTAVGVQQTIGNYNAYITDSYVVAETLD